MRNIHAPTNTYTHATRTPRFIHSHSYPHTYLHATNIQPQQTEATAKTPQTSDSSSPLSIIGPNHQIIYPQTLRARSLLARTQQVTAAPLPLAAGEARLAVTSQTHIHIGCNTTHMLNALIDI